MARDAVVTQELALKAKKVFRERSDYWYYNDRDEDHNLEGIRDALNAVMPEIRAALFAEFQAAQDAKNKA